MIINFIIKCNNFLNNFYSMFSYMNLFTIINYNYSENIIKKISYISSIDLCSLIDLCSSSKNFCLCKQKSMTEIKYKYSQYNYILRNAEKNKKLVNFSSIENIKNGEDREDIFFLQDDGPIMF